MTKVGQLYRETLVSNMKKNITDNGSVFVVSYSNLSAADLNGLRKKLIGAGAGMHVSKNTLAALALKELKHDKLAERVSGQTAFVWTDSDAAAVSKILVEYAKEVEDKFAVKGGLLEEKELEEADVKVLSELPSREVLLSMLLGTISAPITRLLGAFNAKSSDLLSILKQYSEQKGGE